jgi:cytochrome P450 family 6
VDVIAAQAYIFFVAGFETSSATMTFCLYELALNPDIQERVRSEINAVLEKYGGNITYESIFEMKYLDKVVNGERIRVLYFT